MLNEVLDHTMGQLMRLCEELNFTFTLLQATDTEGDRLSVFKVHGYIMSVDDEGCKYIAMDDGEHNYYGYIDSFEMVEDARQIVEHLSNNY